MSNAGFVKRYTLVSRPSLVPEIALYAADDPSPLWHATQELLDLHDLDAPYWAFAWAGGQVLARYLLDHPELVRGRTVLDFATGSGIVGIAAKLAGAARVLGVDIDPLAIEAVAANCALNHVEIEAERADLVGQRCDAWEVIAAGDVFYDRGFAERVSPWLAGLAYHPERVVLVGDPGRNYLPASATWQLLAEYDVPVPIDLEGVPIKHSRVFRLQPELRGWP